MITEIHNDDAETQPYYLELADIFRKYDTSLEGLSVDEHARRLATTKRNTIEKEAEEPVWRRFLSKFTEPLIVLLLVSAAVSVFVGQIDDAISIVLAVIIVSTVAFIQESRSEKAIEALSQYVAHKCHVIRSGKIHEVDAEDLVDGDLVTLRIGDRVPSDLRLVECHSLRADESILTGEHNPSRKFLAALEPGHSSLAERKNMLFMGTMVSSGNGKGVVVATGSKTEFGKISEMLTGVENRKTPLQLKMDQLGKHLSIMSFAIIGVIFFIGALQGNPLLEMFNVGVSLAVAAIPEGLPIVVTVTLALGVTRMSKRNAIVRKLPAVEALGAVSVVCVDKTGTLTQNEMTATQVFTTAMINAIHVGYTGKVEFMDTIGGITGVNGNTQLFELLRAGLLCNDAQIENGVMTGQPTEGALLALALKSGIQDFRTTIPRVDEVPFDSEQKWMGVKCQMDGQNVWFVKGATEVILPRCTSFYNRGTTQMEVQDAYNKMAAASLRVIALAYGDDVNNLTFVGLVGLMDPPRQGVKEAVSITKNSGIKVVMITGDSKETAISVAKDLGIFESDNTSISCAELDKMSDNELVAALDHVTVFYRMAPGHKMKIINSFRTRGQIVAMTGDGVNDAPALKMADIGIAMGQGGSDVCRESAEMILVDNNFATIVAAIEEGKAIYTNIKHFLRFQLSTSMAALTIIASCTLMGWPLPLNPMQILWINIIMDGPPAQSLTFESLLPSAMAEPPRNPETPVIDKPMISKVAGSAFIMVLGTMYLFIGALGGTEILTEEDKEHPNRYACTLAFTSFVMFQMFNALNCRGSLSVFQLGLFSNKFFTFAIGGSIFMQMLVVYLPLFQLIFETVPLTSNDLMRCFVVSSSVFIIDETIKWISQRSARRKLHL